MSGIAAVSVVVIVIVIVVIETGKKDLCCYSIRSYRAI